MAEGRECVAATALEALATVAAAAAQHEAGGIAHGVPDAGHARPSSRGVGALMAGDGGRKALRTYPTVWAQARFEPLRWKEELSCDVENDLDLQRLFQAFNKTFVTFGTHRTQQGPASTCRQWKNQDGYNDKTYPVGLLQVRGVGGKRGAAQGANPSLFKAVNNLVCAVLGNCNSVERRGRSGGDQWLHYVKNMDPDCEKLDVVESLEKRGRLSKLNEDWGAPICDELVQRMYLYRDQHGVDRDERVKMYLLLNAGVNYRRTFAEAKSKTGINGVTGHCEHGKGFRSCESCLGQHLLHHALVVLQAELKACDTNPVLPLLAYDTGVVSSLAVPAQKQVSKRDRGNARERVDSRCVERRKKVQRISDVLVCRSGLAVEQGDDVGTIKIVARNLGPGSTNSGFKYSAAARLSGPMDPKNFQPPKSKGMAARDPARG